MFFLFGHTKISFLKENIVRFEYSPNDHFTNEPTLFIRRKRVDNSSYEIVDKGNGIKCISYKNYEISFDEVRPIDTIKISKEGVVIYSFKGKSNTGELPIPSKTPFVYMLNDSPRIILAEEGYNEYGDYKIEKQTRDIYLLICEKDYKRLRKQIIELSGNNDLPRIKTFGLFHSRYMRYSEKDVYAIVEKYKKNKIPLDNFVLDTDWRLSLGRPGAGYDVDEEMFPDISAFYREMHAKDIEIIMNDHPLPVKKGVDVFSAEEKKYRYENLTRFFVDGLDSWWYDRNWWTHLYSPSKRVSKELLGTYLYHDITKQFFQSFTLDSETYIRPVAMSNISEIRNGEYATMSDSIGHIYPIQWSGDVTASPNSLKQEIKSMIRCSNNMLGYFSSDIGGHKGTETKNTFIRWYQYGCFSPVLRPHCSCFEVKSREPWAYDQATLDTIRKYIDMRYRLLNVWYTAAYKHYNDGLGIIKPLSMVYPNDRKVINDYESYMLGNRILVHPLTEPLLKKLGKKELKGKASVSYFKIEKKKKTKICGQPLSSLEDIRNLDITDEERKSILSVFRFKIVPEHDGDLYILNGIKGVQWGLSNIKVLISNKTALKITSDHQTEHYLKRVKKGKEYSIVLETSYIPNRKVELFISPVQKKKKTKIYLPEGEWFDVTNENVYQGKRFVKKYYPVEDMPLFVKAGTLIPLYVKEDNISRMSLKNVCYDFYPSKKEEINDYYYEDDGTTTAYRIGVLRKNGYELSYKDGTYKVLLKKSENNLDDDITGRNVIFKMHVFDNEKIESVAINGVPTRFYNHNHTKKADVFNSTPFARDSKTLSFKFRQDIKKEYLIEIKVK